MRTTSAAMSGLVLGRLGRRVFEPSYFLATSFRYHRRMVSGVTMPGDGREAPTAEDVAFHGQTASVVVGQLQSSTTVYRAEDAVLLEQVVNDGLLVSIEAAGEQQEEEGERARQRVHRGSLPERGRPFNGCRDWPSVVALD
jgi:hypothetical protein